MLNIPIILGTAREGRQSEKVARFVCDFVKAKKISSEILDVRDFRSVATDNTKTSDVYKKLVEKIEAADGFIIVSPEYNHSFPGELKMMLDLFYSEYAKKPLGICGVSAGPFGGVRMIEQLRTVAVELHMIPIREALYFSSVQNLFDEKGRLLDSNYLKRAEVFVQELTMYSTALKRS